MKTNHDGTITLNAYDTWTSCSACGQRVTGDSIHTCSPQLKPLSDEEIEKVFDNTFKVRDFEEAFLKFARAIEERHGIK